MAIMEKLRMFVAAEPVVAASCLIAGFDGSVTPSVFVVATISGLFLPAVVRPILDSFETAEKLPQPPLSDVVAGMTGKKQA